MVCYFGCAGIQFRAQATHGIQHFMQDAAAEALVLDLKARKRKADGIRRVEIEERLTQEEYISCLVEADPAYRPIHKERYCLSANGLYYEIDVYPGWKDKAIMEIELHSEDQEVVFPDEIDVIREVTDDPAYSNHELARIK